MSTAQRLGVEPVRVFMDLLDIWIETGEALTAIDLKGNSRELYHSRLGDKDVEAIVHVLEVRFT